MKNLFLLVGLFLITSCSKDTAIPLATLTNQIDTVITFDPITFEETIQIVESNKTTSEQKIIETYQIQVDTIITFDADTYEETIEIVRTKVRSKNKQK